MTTISDDWLETAKLARTVRLYDRALAILGGLTVLSTAAGIILLLGG